MAVTDRVSVMRRGEMVATLDTAKTSPAELAELMVGRRVLLRVEKGPAQPGPGRARRSRTSWCATTAASRASTACPSSCAPARSSASPASPATASPSCSKRSPASARSTVGRDPHRRRAPPGAEPRSARAARLLGLAACAGGPAAHRARHRLRGLRERDARLSRRAGLRHGPAARPQRDRGRRARRRWRTTTSARARRC